MDLLADLNEQQRAAVERTDGPVLILAGAGSGKTRVLVYRIAHLLATGKADPSEIVAVTFTNKSADEMKERVARLVGEPAARMRVGTFHSLCLQILRREAPRLGYRGEFQVFDTDDSLRAAKECLKEASLDESQTTARDVLRRISSAKNHGVPPEKAEGHWSGPLAAGYARAYEAYEASLRRMNAMDFDDLILNVLRLFALHPDRLALWSGSSRYLLVDEYQDTNPPQYRLVKALSSVHGNLCVVGDEDQSIYRFRGADIGNILSFQKDFPGTVLVKLTRNYRSTSSILEAANALVRRNQNRIGKDLWTDAGRGESVRFTLLRNDLDEASFVLRALQSWRARGGVLEDVAILYRTNAQSRLFEEALVNARVPYRIHGSLRFYDRREVRDLMAYLRLAVNPADDISLRRVVGVPPRGLGAAAMTAVEAEARKGARSLHDAMGDCAGSGLLPARAAAAARSFLALLADLRERSKTLSPAEMIRGLLREIEYEAYLRRTDGAEADSRLENVESLVAAAEEAASGGLQAFLDRASLVSETESILGDRGVNLMTLHAAKGLEFDAVFLAGMEEGLLPHTRTLAGDEDVEEERRLCYVGMTRARKVLQITAAGTRRLHGRLQESTVSRFVQEIGAEHLETTSTPWIVREEAHERPSARAVPLGEEDVEPGYDEEAESGGSAAWRIGARVRHEQFGVGQVLAVEAAPQGQKLTVRFRGGRTLKVLTRFARLIPA